MGRQFIKFILSLFIAPVFALPNHFVYLHDVAPEIGEDLRYATANNFTGNIVPGYKTGACILTLKAAHKLINIQKQAQALGYQLKVYDCYRPTQAVRAFYKWSQNSNQDTKEIYYPREDKGNLFNKGYIALFSGHSRGSTVDITLVKIKNDDYPLNSQSLCYGKTDSYRDDNSIDTGTRFDCLDPSAHVFYEDLTKQQKANRMLLRKLMINGGFKPYAKEWWHFTLKEEPFPHKYFNFKVQ